MYIQSLPVEILLHIFSFAVLEWSDWGYWEYEPRRRTLYAASLVCRSWRRLAQPLLWEEVHLWTPSRVSEFVAGTAATSLTTRELRLWGRFAADGDPGIARAVDACVGVQKLLLREFCGLDSQTLFLPQPAGLKSFDMEQSFFKGELSALTELPFSLSELIIDTGNEDDEHGRWPPHLLPLLFQPSITKLDICITSTLSESSFTQLLTLAPNLTYLHLNSFRLAPHHLFRLFVAACHSLRRFRGYGNVATGVELIPSVLESWTLDCDYDAVKEEETRLMFEPTLTLLRSEPLALSKLKQLLYARLSREEAPGFNRYEELREECETRGIDLVFRGY